MPFLLLLPVSGHLSHSFTVPPTKACLLCATPAGTYQVQVPHISEDHLLCIMLCHKSVSHMLQKTPEMHEQSAQFAFFKFYYTVFPN